MDADPVKEPLAQKHDAVEASTALTGSTAPPTTEPAAAKAVSVASPKSPLENESTIFAGHDSMVTVRLSEPPSLSVCTDLPPSTLPLRKSIFGPTYTPTGTVAATIRENETASEEEVQQSDNESDSVGADSIEDAAETAADDPTKMSESDEAVPEDDDAEDSETEVDWDKLQQTEDEEAQDGDDKVS